MRVIRQILSKPRSRRFQYRLNDNQQINVGGGSTIINDSRPESQEIGIFDTYSSIPNPPHPEELKLQITQDTDTIYCYDTSTSQWVTQTNDVRQIIQGNNITISPTNGKGIVTINGLTPTLNTIGSGNSVQDMTLSGNTLTKTLGTRMSSLSTSGSGNQVSSLSFNTTNGVLTQNLTTISGGGGSVQLNTSGSGNSVQDLTLSGSTLTKTLGTRMSSLSTSGSGNQVSSLSFNTANGVLTQNMTTISGGGGSGNVNTTGSYNRIFCERATLYNLIIPANGQVLTQNFSLATFRSLVGFNNIRGIVATLGTADGGTAVNPQLGVWVNITNTSVEFYITNCSSSSISYSTSRSIYWIAFGN